MDDHVSLMGFRGMKDSTKIQISRQHLKLLILSVDTFAIQLIFLKGNIIFFLQI